MTRRHRNRNRPSLGFELLERRGLLSGLMIVETNEIDFGGKPSSTTPGAIW